MIAKRFLLTTTMLMTFGIALPQAQAQDSTANDGARSTTIGEIVVTARKREESLQETPISITVFSGADLEDRSLTSLSEIGNFTPNLSFGSTGVGSSDSARVHIRGIGQTDFIITTDPGVGIYVDGVYMARSFGSLFDLLDIERVEVLRGPQGTLYGKNTIGGAVNVVTQKPEAEFGGYAKVTGGRFGRIDGKVSVNVPLVENKLSARVSGMTLNNDGFAKNLFDGSPLSDDETLAARGALRFTPNESLDIELAADVTRKRAHSENVKLVAFNPTGALVVPINFFLGPLGPAQILADPYATNGDFSGPNNVNDLNAFGASLTINWDINENVSAKSITAYREVDTAFGADQDGTPVAIGHTLDRVKQEQFSQEFQLIGTSFDGRLDWVTGIYFISEQANEFNDVDLVPGLFPIIGLDITIDVENKTQNVSYAGFFQGTYQLTDRLSTTLGVRYTYEEKEYFANHIHSQSGIRAITERAQNDWDAFSPKFGLDYQLTDDVLTYASVSRGFKSGGFNGRPLDNSPGLESYNPELVWSYEAGVKSRFMDDRVQLNAAFFYSDYSDVQVTLVGLTDAMGNLLIVVRNAASATMKGFEAELQVRPAEGFDFFAGVGFVDAEYDKFMDGPIDRSGQDFPFTPKWNVNLGGQYRAEIGELGSVTGRLDYSYRSAQFLDAANSPGLRQEAYGLINARIAYETPDGQFQLAAFGKNLNDKAYKVNGIDASSFFGIAFASFGPPRTWGIEATARF